MNEREEGTELVVPREVLTLLEERTKVRGWLEKLQEFRREASSQVFERVRSDYGGRLDAVNTRLGEHRADLESSVARHRARVDELQGGRDEKAAALEEAELRFKVGEYSDSEWDRRRSEGERAIQELDAQLKEERGALVELERVLGDVVSERPARPAGAGEAVGANASGRAAGPGVGAAREPEGETAGRGGAAEPDAAAAAPTGTIPAGREEQPPPEAEGGRAPPVGADEVVEEEEEAYLDELEFLESLSLEDTGRFDAVSLMLEETEEGEEEGKEGNGRGERSP